ncbi:MAG: squalene synthase HpnC [Caldithrix sp. RBG_13_44_9]|nr:MAG: squalene synthase HpnC [Caldithrix sp. RBG_13_44_9]
MNLSAAYFYCQKITREHYENFPVASLFIPAHYRRHIAAIYAFARTADDFSDEMNDRQSILDWRSRLQRCTREKPEHPIFLALSHTIQVFDLPLQWLDDLLTAFLMDLDCHRYQSMQELQNYCKYSANPVGRLVLWIFGYRQESLMAYSDHITTALQLANFWQDISVDLKKDRLYIPKVYLEKYQLSEKDIFSQRPSDNFVLLLRDLIADTRRLFQLGMPLLREIQGRLRWELQLTIAGGLGILKKVEQYSPRILTFRPEISKWDWLKIISTTLSA